MKISQLVQQLENAETIPTQAIQELIARKDESIPVLLDTVKTMLDDYKRKVEDTNLHLYAMFLLSYFREPRAFEYAIKWAQLPALWIDRVLDDAITEGIAKWIVSTYDGDLDAIKSVIENETGETFARCAALDSLVGLVAGLTEIFS